MLAASRSHGWVLKMRMSTPTMTTTIASTSSAITTSPAILPPAVMVIIRYRPDLKGPSA